MVHISYRDFPVAPRVQTSAFAPLRKHALRPAIQRDAGQVSDLLRMDGQLCLEVKAAAVYHPVHDETRQEFEPRPRFSP
jgi:hypothetical protein